MRRRHVYVLTATEEGNKRGSYYERNFVIVVTAVSSTEARKLAASARIDEPEDTWTNPAYSKCRRIGTDAGSKSLIIARENNAS